MVLNDKIKLVFIIFAAGEGGNFGLFLNKNNTGTPNTVPNIASNINNFWIYFCPSILLELDWLLTKKEGKINPTPTPNANKMILFYSY